MIHNFNTVFTHKTSEQVKTLSKDNSMLITSKLSEDYIHPISYNRPAHTALETFVVTFLIPI